MNEPRDHHYVPQFFLRNFAVDPEKNKITTVGKNGDFAIWAQRSIEHLGYERDLYVHLRRGVPVSVETNINSQIETPISKSDTWAKISSGQTHALDRSDKPILYALIRHLEARTPHYFATSMELAELAAAPDSDIPFTEEERQQYAFMRANPEAAKAMFNRMSSSLDWTEQSYKGSVLSVLRSPIPLRSSTTPVLTIGAPAHPTLKLPLPGMIPYQFILTLNPTTIASLVLADFDDGFMNVEISRDIARGFNRHFVGQFAHFEHVRHVVAGRDDLCTDMALVQFDLLKQTEHKIVFRRKSI
jgi:hypothetical protein